MQMQSANLASAQQVDKKIRGGVCRPLKFSLRGDIMNYVDRGIVYIPIDKETTKEEMDKLKNQYPDRTVVFLRSGDKNMKLILSELIKARLIP